MKLWRLLLIGLLVVAALSTPRASTTTASAATSARTVVSFTFDDGWASQAQLADPLLAAHGMNATFFIISNAIGTTDYMTWQQVSALAARGNEIAGHTLDHRDLTTLSSTEARRQVCADRNALLSHGYAVTDFAYPYSAFNASIESIVQACGYNSARTTLWNGFPCWSPCTESIPPQNPYATNIVAFGDDESLADIERIITTAETYGGWAQILIHKICDNCTSGAMRAADLNALLDWLAPRTANGTVVQTVAQVIGGTVKPPVSPDAQP